MRASATPSGPTARRTGAGSRSFALLALLSLCACSDAQPAPSQALSQAPSKAQSGLDCDGRPVRMGVASSLREVAESVTRQLAADRPEIQIEPIFGASSTHARQLRLGAPFDVLVSADADLMAALEEGDWIDRASIREIARGRLILLSRASLHARAPESPPEPSDSTSTGGSQSRSADSAAIFLGEEVKRVAVPSEVVPLGRYARAWLRAQHLLEPLEGKLVTTEHARANLSAVEAGHVDLAFAYGSDRRLLREARFLLEFDEKDYPPIRYVAARTKRSAKCRNAQTVLAAWSYPTTRHALNEAGFSPSQDPPREESVQP